MLAQQPVKVTEIEGITEYRLDNGVQILLFPDPSKPQFTVNMTVLVGSRHEGYGETGMAHLLEHMLFKGTEIHKDIPKLLKDRGVLNMNGTTWLDRTNYYETLPASDDNLEFAIRMEADRLVNSLIRAEDLASEMTVVRNEFEMGENSPTRMLMQRIASAAFDWHNYGKSTIGNRADIERVPVTNLRRFYRKFYQPDNVMVVVAGQFDREKALEYLTRYFGALETPQRELPKTYTEEPPQDGERIVMLRRVGDTQMAGVGYHIPPASHEDYPAVQVLTTILGMEPSGPLYKALVKSRIASSVFAMDIAAHDPSLLLVFTEVPQTGDLEKAKQVLINEIEKIGREGVASKMVDRAKRRLATSRERQFADTSQFAINLSEWRAYGDWRLYFLHRDRVEKVTGEDVQAVAQKYLIRSNRTVGLFIPTENPVRAETPQPPKLEHLLADYKGREAVAQGEAFEPTPDNIERRTTRGELESGLQYAVLPKKTRGERVFVAGRLEYGSADSLKEYVAAAELLPELLSRGTKTLDFEQFKDRLQELNATMVFGGEVGRLSFSIQTKRENLLDVLDLLRDALREPALDAELLEIIKRENTTQLESLLSDPQGLAQTEIQRRLKPYPPGHVLYMPTLEESIERIRSTTADEIRDLHERFLNGEHGQVAIVGDFDADAALEKLNEVFADWHSDQPFQRIEDPAQQIKPDRVVIRTPDKKNAVYVAGTVLPMRDDNPDYDALLIGNYILGGGPLSSRLADRVRKKEGLSYGVGSVVQADSLDPRAASLIFAITNPANIEKVDSTIEEEVTRLLESGVTADELQRARESYLQNRRGSRAQDRQLVRLLLNNLRTGRTMEFQQQSDQRIESLTKEQVDATLRRYIDPGKFVIIEAGDFQPPKTETRNRTDEADDAGK